MTAPPIAKVLEPGYALAEDRFQFSTVIASHGEVEFEVMLELLPGLVA